MPNLTLTIGDTFTYTKALAAYTPADETVIQAVFAIKANEADSDNVATILKDITEGDHLDGSLAFDSDDNATLTIKVHPFDSVDMTPNIWYWYGVKILTDVGSEITVTRGRILAVPQTVQAP